MSEQIEEIFAYYGKQQDKSSQEMVIALLRELQEAEGALRGIEGAGYRDDRNYG